MYLFIKLILYKNNAPTFFYRVSDISDALANGMDTNVSPPHTKKYVFIIRISEIN